MWLKIVYDEDDIAKRPFTPKSASVSIHTSTIAPVDFETKSFRVSPVFSLIEGSVPDLSSKTVIYFFSFSNAYRVLGRIEKKGSEELKQKVYFSIGLSSVLLITSEKKILKEFQLVVQQKENASEEWYIKEAKLLKIVCHSDDNNKRTYEGVPLVNYSILPAPERTVIDEFNITVKLLLLKLENNMPYELPKIKKLIEEINSMISELIFLFQLKGEKPDTLSEYTVVELQNPDLNHRQRHQILDRIIQVNSALSYVSTQAFSGAIPILERRSLIRRYSLLGIGSAMLALNNIARYIEQAFAKVPFEKIIKNSMTFATPLKGTESLANYNSDQWNQDSIDRFSVLEESDSYYYKLPYFSGRLGFRETEYSIAAAIQSISCGASLEWSLMTLTHEMLHGHVRGILTSIFDAGTNIKDNVQRDIFYQKFEKKMLGSSTDEKMIDSVRNILLVYCCLTKTHGSLTSRKPYVAKFGVQVLRKDDLWNELEREYRNISEIFVHVLDLHYFYASRIEIYIPLIWCSWVSVPHINGDIRQYILRSLLAIASRMKGGAIERFNYSVSRLNELLAKHKDQKLKYPVINDVISILIDKKKLNDSYFSAFKVSLGIVDLVEKVFLSSKIRSSLFHDQLVSWDEDEDNEDSLEKKFSYNMPSGFNDEVVKSPLSYLLDRMIKELNSDKAMSDIEKETAIQFLALNSHN